jgi:hypothetical protein
MNKWIKDWMDGWMAWELSHYFENNHREVGIGSPFCVGDAITRVSGTGVSLQCKSSVAKCVDDATSLSLENSCASTTQPRHTGCVEVARRHVYVRRRRTRTHHERREADAPQNNTCLRRHDARMLLVWLLSGSRTAKATSMVPL